MNDGIDTLRDNNDIAPFKNCLLYTSLPPPCMGWERKKPPYNWHRTSGFPMRTGTVSYTHLDVYKRQDLLPAFQFAL